MAHERRRDVAFIGPSLPFIGGKNAINDNSVAFILEYKHFRMLFTGDAGSTAGRRFLSECIDLHADVLKVGHHGSKTSTMAPFLEAVSPSIAIISAGYENSFGHPHPDVVRRLEERHITILRTDNDGLVTVRTDGQNLAFDSMAWGGPRFGQPPAFDLSPPTP